jgi:LuxR family maltose regulon positive regulatory protein
LEQLDRGREQPLTLVVAPAGYGKTSQVAAWLEACDWPSTWLALDEQDSDLNLFLGYIIAAIQSIFPDACKETAALVETAAEIPIQVLSRTLVNELVQIKKDFLLVLDDYHHVREMAVHNLITEILRHPPRALHLVLVSRTNPALSLPTLRAKMQISELRREDLRFTEVETAAFLKQELGTPMVDDIVTTLLNRVEGWVAGMRLAVLSLRHRGNLEPLPAHLRGSISYVTDYLAGEVLENQEPAIQDYMLYTSILDRFCAPLCQALAGASEADIDGQAFLDWLVGSNLFVVPLDNQRRWYRYHHLFQELLQHRLEQRLSAEQIADLHKRASAWFAENGLIHEALQHAIAAGDITSAVKLVAEHRRDLMNQEQWHNLGRWLRLFPPKLVEGEPELLVTKAWVLYNRSQNPEMVAVLDQAETLLARNASQTAAAKHHQAEIDAMRCEYVLVYEVDSQQAITLARRALAEIPDEWFNVRGQIYITLGYGYLMLGEPEQGIGIIYDALKADKTGSSMFRARLLTALCYLHYSNADVPELGQAASQLLKLGQTDNLADSTAYGRYFLGCFHYLRDELLEVERYLVAAASDHQIAQIWCTINSACVLALTYQALDKPHQAQDTIGATITYLAEMQNVEFEPQLQALQAELALRQEHLGEASRWARKFDPYPLPLMVAFYIPQLTLVKVLLAQDTTTSRKQTADLLSKLYDHVLTDKRFMIEVLALQALLDDAQGDQASALDKLERAIQLAEPGGFMRTFVDLGPPMANLLIQLGQQGVSQDYVALILNAFPQAQPPPLSAAQSQYIEPLTKRELEVIALLAQRLSNKEIAIEMVISPATVRNHTHNIFDKLNVIGRRQAVTKATELGILSHE